MINLLGKKKSVKTVNSFRVGYLYTTIDTSKKRVYL